MRLTTYILRGNRRDVIPGHYQRGEYRGDGNFDHTLVGEVTLEAILVAWRVANPYGRGWILTGPEESVSLVLVHVEPAHGVRLIEVLADDTTGLFPLDVIEEKLGAGHIEHYTAPADTPEPAPKGFPTRASLEEDPNFWRTEHDL